MECSKKGFRDVIAHRDFAKLWFGQTISNVGSGISYLALMVFTFQLTGSAFTMAIVGIMQVVPSIIFSGAIGVYIDKWDRKKIMIASDIVRIITALCIPLVEVFSNFVPLLAPVDFIYMIVFIYSIANVFFYPARNASIPNLVELDELVTANSLSQLTYQLVTLMFMPIGGILVEILAPDYYIAFMLDASTFLISAIVIASVTTSLKPKRVEKAEDSFRKQLMDGASVIRNSGVLSFILSIFFVVMIGAGMINALIVPFLEDDLNFGAFELGLVMGGSSALGVVGAAILGKRSKLEKPLYILAGSMVLAGFMVSGLSISVDLLGVLIFFSLVGLVNVTIAIPSNALLQELVSDELRGRVFAFQSVMINTAQVFGMIVAGLWAESIGTSRPPLSFAGVFLLIVGTLAFGIIARKNMHFGIDEKRRIRSEAEKEHDRLEEITPHEIEDQG